MTPGRHTESALESLIEASLIEHGGWTKGAANAYDAESGQIVRGQCDCSAWGGWLTGFGAGGMVNGTAQTDGIETTLGGFVAGIDRS